LILIPFIVSCSSDTGEPDAWGNFEANEIIISSEINGKILKTMVAEGDIIKEGDLIAIIDSTMLSLQIGELRATARSISTRLLSIDAQNRILEQQIDNLVINISRVKNMLGDGAATRKQYDDLTGQVEVLKRQIEANNTQKTSVGSELAVLEAKKMQITEQIARCMIKAPSGGTVIRKYSETGEVTAAGKPLVKIADLTIMKLKVYVSGAHLSEIQTGDNCEVRIDRGEKGYSSFEGTITNISDKAEFTPKIIQTKEERVSLVYAVTIKVENDGSIKSGMPGEAIFRNLE